MNEKLMNAWNECKVACGKMHDGDFQADDYMYAEAFGAGAEWMLGRLKTLTDESVLGKNNIDSLACGYASGQSPHLDVYQRVVDAYKAGMNKLVELADIRAAENEEDNELAKRRSKLLGSLKDVASQIDTLSKEQLAVLERAVKKI